MLRWTLSLLAALQLCDVIGAEVTNHNEAFPGTLTFYPARIDGLVEKAVATVYFNYSVPQDQHVRLKVKIDDTNPQIAAIKGTTEFDLARTSAAEQDEEFWNSSQFRVQGLFLGRTYARFSWQPKESRDGVWRDLDVLFPVAVVRQKRILDDIFLASVLILVTIANVGMGCKVDLKVVKEVLRKPVSPIIGFCCQFLIMPSLAFGIAKLLNIQGGLGLGFFAMGCAPGGGASNIYSYLLGGDISLSITMTLISTVAALGMMPLWMFTLGRFFIMEGSGVQIPYTNILGTLVGIIVPTGIGVIIQRKRPRWAKKIGQILRPFLIIFVLFMFTFGVYVNLYIFKLFTPTLILAGVLLPYISFVLSGVVAWILRRSMSRIITISIETGIQNPGIPILTMRFSLPQPDGDLSIVSPVVVSTFTPVPLMIAVIIVEVRKRCFGKECLPDGVPRDPVDDLKEEVKVAELTEASPVVPRSEDEVHVKLNDIKA